MQANPVDVDSLGLVMQIAKRFLNDLCWAVNSPSLLGASGLLSNSENASLRAWRLNPDDVDPEHLRHHLSQGFPRRSGRYFEQLILYWLEHVRGCPLVAYSQQVRDGKRTVGEIDVLFVDEDGRLTHWELALKFYLQVASGKIGPNDYVGPNARDTLQRKVTRLIEHQLPLTRRYFPDVEVRQAFVKGRIFYPWSIDQGCIRETPLPSGETGPSVLAADHLRGQWLRMGEVVSAFKTSALCYRVMKKPFWLAEENSDQASLSAIETVRFLQDHFEARTTPIRLTGSAIESSPPPAPVSLFIVADHWPND